MNLIKLLQRILTRKYNIDKNVNYKTVLKDFNRIKSYV